MGAIAPAVTATIRAGSPRAATWRRIFGAETIPLKSPFPVIGDLPGLGPGPVLFVDVAALSAEQLERVVAHIAETFRAEPATVRADLLGDHGLPILAEDVTVLMPIVVPIGSA